MKPELTSFRGSCHCGNVEIVFESALKAEELPVRACACSFCRRHGALSTSDPKGSVKIAIHDSSRLIRYRFGLKTADFLICKRCGVYLAAVMAAGGKSYAVVNINTLDFRERFRKEPATVSYDGESEAERIARRKANWTPVIAFSEQAG